MDPYMAATKTRLDGVLDDAQSNSLLLTDPARWQAALEIIIDEQCRIVQKCDKELEHIPSNADKRDLRNVAAFSRRSEAMSRLFMAEKELASVNKMIHLRNDPVEETVYTLLRKAIERHRELNEFPSYIDLALYEALDGRWGFEDMAAI